MLAIDISLPSEPGSYILVLYLASSREISVGKIGTIYFKEGYYVYVGSALNGLYSRLKRHLRRDRKDFWHLDYFLRKSRVVEIVSVVNPQKIECSIAGAFAETGTVVEGFGASDCGCNGHLFHFSSKPDVRSVLREKSMLALGKIRHIRL